jgi:hypothetical protein
MQILITGFIKLSRDKIEQLRIKFLEHEKTFALLLGDIGSRFYRLSASYSAFF